MQSLIEVDKDLYVLKINSNRKGIVGRKTKE